MALKILLDNGHGNDTPGKRSPEWQDEKQLFEWEFNRDIVDQVSAILTAEHYDVEILVPEKKDIPIRERVDRANEIHAAKESILVSIHGNAAPNQDTKPHGIETFYGSLEGKILANELQKTLVSHLGWKDRGIRKVYQRIKTAEGKRITIYKIAIVKYTDCVTVLTENGFYTNFEQCKQMNDPEVRTTIALAHVQSVKQYLFNKNQ